MMIGLGLMLLALRLVTVSTEVLTRRRPSRRCWVADQRPAAGDHRGRGAGRGVVLQPGHRAADRHAGSTSVIPVDVALGLVLGANLGSGLLAVLTTLSATDRDAAGAAGQSGVQGAGHR
jgi:phosphate:Na+ symporter